MTDPRPDEPKSDVIALIENELQNGYPEWEQDPNCKDADGMTMFDLPNSKDNLIAVLISRAKLNKISAHSIVEIRSRKNGGDGRVYRAIVVAGTFHEPDGLKGDAPLMVATTINGMTFMPNYHGRVIIEILGEMIDGMMRPPRFRPRPNSPVFVLGNKETAEVLKVDGNIRLGMAIGHDDIEVHIPGDSKTVLPRHMGILGTTGGGKSTTVSGLIAQFQQEKIATIIIDTEGEYTNMDKPAEKENMIRLLESRGLKPHGIENLEVFYPRGRETRASGNTPKQQFCLQFSDLSPYAAADILGLNEAQSGRFFKAYDTAKLLLNSLKMVSAHEQFDLDEFETGYPKLSLDFLIDTTGLIIKSLSKDFSITPLTEEIRDNINNADVESKVRDAKKDTTHEGSWKALYAKLHQLRRTNVFGKSGENQIPFARLIQPGRVTVIDLSDSDSTVINNIVIANILRGIQKVQETAYEQAVKSGGKPNPVVIIIEEAHEFLSREKIKTMTNLFEQVARIARRGRKRWLGLIFVTQLPQHLPDEVLGLINSFILHKISDGGVISRLKKSIGGLDENLWNRLANLAQGQAIVSAPSLTRPLLVAMDPTPCKLLMID